MEKCWISERERKKNLIGDGVSALLSAGMITASLIGLWLMNTEVGLPPIVVYPCFFFGICLGFEVIIRGARSITLLLLWIISIANIAGADFLSPILICGPIGLVFGFGLLFFVLAIIGPIEQTREYELSDQGITVQYLGKYRRFYPWDSIRNICVCTLFRKSDLELGKLAIWCTAGKIRFEPPKGNANRTAWNQQEYILMHFRTVLTMTYTPERLEEFRKNSRREIPDYRNL